MGAAPRAVIFDLDGVLVNSAPVHAEAYRRLFDDEGIPVPPGGFEAVAAGRSRAEVLRAIAGPVLGEGFEDALPRLMARKVAFMEQVLAEQGLPTVPGAAALLDALHAAGVPLALSTTSRTPELLLERAGLGGKLRHIASSRDVPRPKPAPDTYELALSFVGVAAADAVAIEDSDVGVAAARAAGIPTDGLGSPETLRATRAVYATLRAWQEAVLPDLAPDWTS